MEPAIRVAHLRKEYGDVTALEDLSLEVPRGSFFGLLGPNGAGKTTFINVLVGLVEKSGGEAAVFGHDVVSDYQAARDCIGLSPQEFNVDRFFPIQEVLEFKAGYHGVPKAEATERAETALQRVGIYDKRDTRFDWLSGGMKRRFVLARALVTDPELLILDEPTAGVDVELRHDLWELITDLNDDGTTVLLTTHYIEEAERLCDEVAIIQSGEIETVASPEELTEAGLDTIELTLEDPPATALDLEPTPPKKSKTNGQVADSASAEPLYDSMELEDDTLVVRASRGGEAAPELIRRLDSLGHTVVDIDITRTSLEDVFVGVTGDGPTIEAGEVTQ